MTSLPPWRELQRGVGCPFDELERDEWDLVVADIESAGGRAIAVAADVGIEADVDRLFAACDRELGPLAGLVKNAGVLETQSRVESIDAARLLPDEASYTTAAFINVSGGK